MMFMPQGYDLNSYVTLEIEQFERLPVDDHLDSNVLEEEPKGAEQRCLPPHSPQSVLPAHWEEINLLNLLREKNLRGLATQPGDRHPHHADCSIVQRVQDPIDVS